MKKSYWPLYLFLFIFGLFGICQAATVGIGRNLPDANGVKIQGHAENPKYDASLSASTLTFNVSSSVSWAAYAPNTGCKYRTMSSSTRVGMWKTWPDGAWDARVVGPNVRQVSFSSCANGEFTKSGANR